MFPAPKIYLGTLKCDAFSGLFSTKEPNQKMLKKNPETHNIEPPPQM